jgi:hypothetical protein
MPCPGTANVPEAIIVFDYKGIAKSSRTGINGQTRLPKCDGTIYNI